MFVVMTLSGCAVGWIFYHLEWIRQRRAVLERDDVAVPIIDFVTKEAWDYPPWPLGWFGAQAAGHPVLFLPTDTSDAELARVQALFPETTVHRHSIATSPSTTTQ